VTETRMERRERRCDDNFLVLPGLPFRGPLQRSARLTCPRSRLRLLFEEWLRAAQGRGLRYVEKEAEILSCDAKLQG